MCDNYYDEIIKYAEQNILLNNLIDDVIYKLSYELQKKLNQNITIFHHSTSEQVKIEHLHDDISFFIGGIKYTVNRKEVVKKYNSLTMSAPYSEKIEIMKECLLIELSKIITKYYQ